MDVQTVELSPPMSVLRDDGTADPTLDPGLDAARLTELYAAMRKARVIDERAATLGDAGHLGFLPSCQGREAAIVGATAALSDGDWIFPNPTDWAVALTRGQTLSAFAHRLHGNAHDPLKGHDMPAGISAKAQKVASSSAPAATHLPHAVGVAWSAVQKGDDLVAAAFFDAHEVDAADFHTGLNFAGVMKVPVLFVCRVAADQPGAAEHAVAYGLDAVRCDGSDLLAVVQTVRAAAVSRKPTVIDLVLSDDTDAALSRARAHLEGLGAWDADHEAALVAETEANFNAALDAAVQAEAPVPASIFDGVFASLPPHLRAQRAALESSR
ncbi:MAG: thiamine pyrophosphate-dependent dehydrogenase E1 component subunit alpha [Sandaracinaceae bacterium]